MKFEKLIMQNFMRYSGTNVIEFSCDDIKNVTVVLGDNTVGKTTIAQAFRWGLYGNLLIEKGKKPDNYILLNHEVISLMDANARATVGVEIVIENENKRYSIRREITYLRNFPGYTIREVSSKKLLSIGSLDEEQIDLIQIKEDKIDEVINELFPMDLSHYFLFDGEKWSDIQIGGVRENIKESVHKLTGLSSVKQGMYHLKDMGRNSVISRFKEKVTGTGAIYDSLVQDIKKDEYSIEKYKENLATAEQNIKYQEEQCSIIDEFLLTNKSTEDMQIKYKNLEDLIRSNKQNYEVTYKGFVNDFSDNSIYYFAQPMVKAMREVLKSIKPNTPEMPYISKELLDYLLSQEVCLCGNSLKADSKEYQFICKRREQMQQKKISTKGLEYLTNQWSNHPIEIVNRIKCEAVNVKNAKQQYDNIYNDLKKLEEAMEQHIDFADKRSSYQYHKKEILKWEKTRVELLEKIKSCQRHIEKIEQEKRSAESKTVENQKWKERILIASELYRKLSEEFTAKENEIFLKLNAHIQKNFNEIFNAKDKKVELDKHYNINMLYKRNEGYFIENNLSEGEKIARNFAFIVTIMEYSKMKKLEGDAFVDTLPMVLDGPFSKLGEENIELIANVLPRISDQVIIFMLKKDWEYTQLDGYVGSSYYIDKPVDKMSASIKKKEREV